MEHFAGSVCDDGQIWSEVKAHVPRASIARTLVDVAHSLSALHEQSRIHGDLKPQNVLLTQVGIELIDQFEIAKAGRAPGWTPGWSAPEQLIGTGVLGTLADIYPLGVMVAQLLEAELVGEVKHHIAPRWSRGTRQHKVLHDPAPYISEGTTVLAQQDVLPWTTFVMDCLRTDPNQRPASASEFAERLQELIDSRPLMGFVEVVASEMPMIAATLHDGSDVIARVIVDETPEFLKLFTSFRTRKMSADGARSPPAYPAYRSTVL